MLSTKVDVFSPLLPECNLVAAKLPGNQSELLHVCTTTSGSTARLLWPLCQENSNLHLVGADARLVGIADLSAQQVCPTCLYRLLHNMGSWQVAVSHLLRRLPTSQPVGQSLSLSV